MVTAWASVHNLRTSVGLYVDSKKKSWRLMTCLALRMKWFQINVTLFPPYFWDIYENLLVSRSKPVEFRLIRNSQRSICMVNWYFWPVFFKSTSCLCFTSRQVETNYTWIIYRHHTVEFFCQADSLTMSHNTDNSFEKENSFFFWEPHIWGKSVSLILVTRDHHKGELYNQS